MAILKRRYHAGDRVKVDLGDEVKSGEILYEIDNSEVSDSKPEESYYVVSFSVDMDDYDIISDKLLSSY